MDLLAVMTGRIFEGVAKCERLCAEASMKTENRKREHAGLMESLELRTVRGRDRERENTEKLYYKKL